MKTTLIISPKSKALLAELTALKKKKAELEKIYQKMLKEETAESKN